MSRDADPRRPAVGHDVFAPQLGSAGFESSPFESNNQPENRIILMGEVLEDDIVQVNHLFRTITRLPYIPGGRTSMEAEILTERGEVLATSRVLSLESVAEQWPLAGMSENSPSPPYRFYAVLPNREEGSLIRIREGQQMLAEIRPPERQTSLSISKVDISDSEVQLEWDLDGNPPPDTTYWVRWSDDDGSTWNSGAVGLTETSASLELAAIPGKKVRFQVALHDGFYSNTAETGEIELPDLQPELAIIYPVEGASLTAGIPLHLYGMALGGNQESLPEDDLIWTIDDEEVGRGADIWVFEPEIGRHVLGFHREGSASASITIDIQRK